MERHTHFMQRCFDLARLGAGNVSPNPMVGAVLVHNDRIIGEGYHRRYGQAHAEVNAVASVGKSDRHLLSQSTLYVSLEPCCIFGNTPPCTRLIIKHGIPRVVTAALDLTPGVAGQGVRILREAGVEVITGILEEQGKRLGAIRNIFVTKARPYVILKYAQTADGFIARSDGQPFWISNVVSRRLVHKWRSEVDAIVVGRKTALLDNPQLTNRLYFGRSPRRIVLDRELDLPANLSVFDQSAPTIVAHAQQIKPAASIPGIEYLPVLSQYNLQPLLAALYERKISTLLVEGGAKVLQSFIDQDLWDEARVFQGHQYLITGIGAPHLPVAPAENYVIDTDQMRVYYRSGPGF